MTSSPLPVLVTVTLCGWLRPARWVGSKFTWVRWIPACVTPSQRTRLLKLSATSIAPESPSMLRPRGPSTWAAPALESGGAAAAHRRHRLADDVDAADAMVQVVGDIQAPLIDGRAPGSV